LEQVSVNTASPGTPARSNTRNPGWLRRPSSNSGGPIRFSLRHTDSRASALTGLTCGAVDEFTREALAIEVEHTIDAEDTAATLKRIIAERGTAPENLRADSGPRNSM
jgi:hypothetical protein